MMRVLALLMVLLPVVAACGDDDEATPTATPEASAARSAAPSESSTARPTAAADPEATATAAPSGGTYTVQPGDTLNAIAGLYGVSVEAIVSANGIAEPGSIRVGQVLVIPGAGTAEPPPPPTQPPPTTGGGEPPTSGGVTLLHPVDKQHALPASYVPPGLETVPAQNSAPGFSGSLRGDVIASLQGMLGAASAAGHDVRVVSAYRSYSQQVATFQYLVDTLGYDQAVRVSAMAGHSEHQLGSTVDLSIASEGWQLEESFGSTAAGQWLAAHGHEYGFALSYPAGAEPVTGYAYEPWHFRYIGEAEAAEWKASGLTLNQFLGA
jgi:D-alanyl-D-alanine carboxypeptidase